jgi:translation initiation factor 4A
MAKSAALNPASMPFFPGGQRNTPGDETQGSTLNLGFNGGQRAFHGQDRSSFSSNTTSSASDYRSMRSTPSPPQQLEGQNSVRQQSPSALEPDNPRRSPTVRQSDAQKAYPVVESRIVREGSMFGTLGTLPEKDERLYGEEDEHVTRSGHQTPSSANYSAARQQQFQQQQVPIEQLPPFLPFALNNAGRTISVSSYSSDSPVPSQESNSRATPVTGSPIQNFEAQLRASPLIQDLLDRMIRCEYVSREIQQDVSDLNRKVNILIGRAVSSSSQPEFKDPFSPASASTMQPRPSIGNIAPNQAATSDDISSISQRLNTLTSSVGQLLALQTQQMQQQNLTSPDGRNSIIGLNSTPLEFPPNQMMPPASSSAMLGHTLPGRPDIRQASRQQNSGSRIWSSGTLELPMRPSPQEAGNKRRSSGLVRRDSAGVSVNTLVHVIKINIRVVLGI